MATEKQINYLITSFELDGSGQPLDSRQMVSTYSKIFDLYNTYVGMLIYVQFSEEDSKGTNAAGIYVVKAINPYGKPTRVLFIEDYLHISEKANKPSESPTVNNFASFDENGNVLDSTYNKDSFAPMAQAMPLPQLGDEGKILGYEATEGAEPVVGWVLKPANGDDAYGVYEKEYKALHSGSTDGMLTRPQWLASLKGAKGDDGHNPNLGSYTYDGSSYSPALPSTGIAGDYIIIIDTSSVTQTAKRYVYDSSYTSGTTGHWKQTDIEVDDAEFATSEKVYETSIDNSKLKHPVTSSLAKAEDVMHLQSKLQEVGLQDILYEGEISSSTGIIYNGNIAGTSGKYIEIEIPEHESVKTIRFISFTRLGSWQYAPGYVLGHYDGADFKRDKYAQLTLDETEHIKEYIVTVPAEATHLRVTIQNYITTGQTDSVDYTNLFYCYSQVGSTIKDIVEFSGGQKLNNTKIDNICYSKTDETRDTDVASAKCVSKMISSVGNVDFVETKVERPVSGWNFNPDEETPDDIGSYYYSDELWHPTESGYTTASTRISVEGYDMVRFSGYARKATSICWGFLDEDNNFIEKHPYKDGSVSDSDTHLIEIKAIVPQNAKYLICLYSFYNDGVFTEDKFYCYLINGTDINTKISEVENKVTKDLSKIDKKYIPNIYQTKRLKFSLGESAHKWTNNYYDQSTIFPVNPGDVVHVESKYNRCHIAFFSDYPTPIAGETSDKLISFHLVNSNTLPDTRDIKVPSAAHYMYVSLFYYPTSNVSCYAPSKIEITTLNNVIIDSYLDDGEYDTYIEEDILKYNSGIGSAGLLKKLYKRDRSVDYRLIMYASRDDGATVGYYDSSMQLIEEAFNYSSATYQWNTYRMAEMNIPDECEYIELRVRMRAAGDLGLYTDAGCGALMKPLKNDGTMPKNQLVYCVSKIMNPLIPHEYSENEKFTRNEIWSAWAFQFPYGASGITGAKYPLVAYFHGGSGFVTSENMGYNANVKSTSSIVGRLKEKGCVVFDINGMGISGISSGDYSSHQGCPLAVLTVKKAYEILTTRFNCRRGMVLSGVSMGGQMAKSYAMTYPGDVVAVGLLAPGEIGVNLRFEEQSDLSVIAKSWGYPNFQAMVDDKDRKAFIGYSPCVKPAIIQLDGTIKNMEQVMDYTASDMRDANNLNKFVGFFPVEIKIWHGDSDQSVNINHSKLFVNTVRNANCNATLRICPGEGHNIDSVTYVKEELVDYIIDKIRI